MGNVTLIDEMRIAIEDCLKGVVTRSIPDEYKGILPMLTYHMGWEGEGAGIEAQGKRIRPVLVLLCASAAGGDWRKALPAAAAVELIHNFSLIHDDIQDRSPKRRGRETVWVKWGIAQAINAGDAMFTLAFVALQELKAAFPADVVLEAYQILYATCLRLTGGQYLDLAYENVSSLPQDDYWPMVSGKTAALLACCSELGAISAQVSLPDRKAFRTFGEKLGLAFQVQDDLLGIWGDSQRTGKSNESDLVSGKKSLPVVYALHQKGAFAQRWFEGEIQPGEVDALAQLLDREGARSFTRENADRLTQEALESLASLHLNPEGKQVLYQLAQSMLRREY